MTYLVPSKQSRLRIFDKLPGRQARQDKLSPFNDNLVGKEQIDMATAVAPSKEDVKRQEDIDAGKLPFETSTSGTLSLGKYHATKIGKVEKGTEQVKYDTLQIDESSATDPATLVEEILSFLDNDFKSFKKAVIRGANAQRSLMDAPGLSPFERIMKAAKAAGVSENELLELLTKK